jgi:hypothetical protein
MKYLKSIIIAFTFLTIFSFSANADTLNIENIKDITSNIEEYISTVDQTNTAGYATIYVNLLMTQNGDLHTVDFMVTDEGEVVILSNEYEDEFYRVETFSSKLVEKYTVSISTIKKKTEKSIQ